MSKTIDELLSKSATAFENGKSNEQILAKMTPFGYHSQKMDEGLELREETQQKVIIQKKEYGEQYAATDACDTKKDEIHETYIDHVELTRIAIRKDREAYTALDLGERKRITSGYIQQGVTFYTNLLANNAWVEELSQFSITKEILEAGKSSFLELQELYASQNKETGEAQKATEVRDESVAQLDEWYNRYIKVARIALKNDPQLLEILGIKA